MLINRWIGVTTKWFYLVGWLDENGEFWPIYRISTAIENLFCWHAIPEKAHPLEILPDFKVDILT